jgi:hypothetical protein
MYSESEPLRQLQLQETSADMGRILEKVPGLIAALSEAGGRELGQRWNVADSGDTSDANLMSQRPVHLELVLSASELALLPFELAQSPEGCPGSGRPLLLQSQMPICLTRRVRHNNHAAISWNRPPRILLAAASPGGVVPLQEHVNAIVLALQPWVDRSESLKTDPAERYNRLSAHLDLNFSDYFGRRNAGFNLRASQPGYGRVRRPTVRRVHDVRSLPAAVATA